MALRQVSIGRQLAAPKLAEGFQDVLDQYVGSGGLPARQIVQAREFLVVFGIRLSEKGRVPNHLNCFSIPAVDVKRQVAIVVEYADIAATDLTEKTSCVLRGLRPRDLPVYCALVNSIQNREQPTIHC